MSGIFSGGGGGGISTTLTNTHILVGNASNVATDVAVSGDATMANTGALTVTNAAVIGKVLTGYSSGAGTVSATDTILQGINKLNGNDALKAPIANPVFTGTVTAPIITSGTANPASAGTLRLANNTDSIQVRKADNSGNMVLSVNASNQLVYSGGMTIGVNTIYAGCFASNSADIASVGAASFANPDLLGFRNSTNNGNITFGLSGNYFATSGPGFIFAGAAAGWRFSSGGGLGYGQLDNSPAGGTDAFYFNASAGAAKASWQTPNLIANADATGHVGTDEAGTLNRFIDARLSYMLSLGTNRYYGTSSLTTTDATPTNLWQYTNNATPPVPTDLPANSAFTFVAYVTAYSAAGPDNASYYVTGSGHRVASDFVLDASSVLVTIFASTGLLTASVAWVKDSSVNRAALRVTGVAATTIHWVADVTYVVAS